MIGESQPRWGAAVAWAALLGVVLAPSGARANGETDSRTGDHIVDRWHQSMGTLIHVTVWGDADAMIGKAIDQVFAEFDRLDKEMTVWTPESEISRINAAAGNGKAIKVSDENLYLIGRALEASRLTHGMFDITVGSFWGLWKFDEDNDGTIPTREQVDERRKLVDFRDVLIDARKKTVRLKRKGQQITLGGIAKGYAVDRAVKILRAAGLVDFIVQAGGDMYVSGRRGDRRWRVGIRDPRGGRDVYFAVAEVEDLTFSTSGDYERFVIKDGVRYHHIIDPRTGYPATRSRSVTVMAKDATTADELSKAFFILGPDEGMKLVEALPDVEAVLVGADNKVYVSTGLEGKVTILQPPSPGI